MNRTGNLQYNRVAVTAFVICLLAGLFVERVHEGSCSTVCWDTGRPVSAACHQGDPAMGEGCAAPYGALCGAARAGDVFHRAGAGRS